MAQTTPETPLGGRCSAAGGRAVAHARVLALCYRGFRRVYRDHALRDGGEAIPAPWSPPWPPTRVWRLRRSPRPPPELNRQRGSQRAHNPRYQVPTYGPGWCPTGLTAPTLETATFRQLMDASRRPGHPGRRFNTDSTPRVSSLLTDDGGRCWRDPGAVYGCGGCGLREGDHVDHRSA